MEAVPDEACEYVLAIGSHEGMERCKKVTVSLTSQYVQDERIAEINARAVQVRKRRQLPYKQRYLQSLERLLVTAELLSMLFGLFVLHTAD